MSPSPVPSLSASPTSQLQQMQQHKQQQMQQHFGPTMSVAGRGSVSPGRSASRSSSLSSSLSSLTWLTSPLTCRQSPTGPRLLAPQVCYVANTSYAWPRHRCRNNSQRQAVQPQGSQHGSKCPPNNNDNSNNRTKGKGSSINRKRSNNEYECSDHGEHSERHFDDDNAHGAEGSDDDEYDDVFGPEFKENKENSRSVTPEDILAYDWANNAHKKPPFAYATLIFMALRESDKDKLSLSEIYDYVLENFAYYRHARCGWKNSIRHNLSQESCFLKVERHDCERGKGGYWMLNPDFVDFDQMMTRRRRKFKRRRSGRDSDVPTHAKWSQGTSTCCTRASGHASAGPCGSGGSTRRSSKGTRRSSKGKKHAKATAINNSNTTTTTTTSSSNRGVFTAAPMPLHTTPAASPRRVSSDAHSRPSKARQGVRRLSPAVIPALRETFGASFSSTSSTSSTVTLHTPQTPQAPVVTTESELSLSMSHLGLRTALTALPAAHAQAAKAPTQAAAVAAATSASSSSSSGIDDLFAMDLSDSFVFPARDDGTCARLGTDAKVQHAPDQSAQSQHLQAALLGSTSHLHRRPSFQAILSQLHTPGTSFAAAVGSCMPHTHTQAQVHTQAQAQVHTHCSGAGSNVVGTQGQGQQETHAKGEVEEEIDDSDKPIPQDWLLC